MGCHLSRRDLWVSKVGPRPRPRWPVPCLVVLLSSAGEEQGRGLGKPKATTQLESVSAEKLTEYLYV